MYKKLRKSTAACGKSLLMAGSMLLATSVFAQSSWNRTYGGMNEDAGLSLVETPDTGYLVAGFTGSYGNGASDAYILKTDSVGQFQWFKTYGGANVDIAKKIVPAAGGGYFVAGFSNSYTMDYDFWMLRLDASGDSIWTRKAGGSDWDRAYSAAADGAGKYMVVGETYSDSNQFADGLIVNIDDAGTVLWSKHFSLPGNEYFKDVVKISDTRYAAVGSKEDPVMQTTDGFVLFFDAAGNFTDTVYYDYGFNEYLNCMAISPTFDLMLGGYYTYDTTAFPKSIQIKIDSSGVVEFPLLAGTADDFGMHILSYGHYSGDIFFFAGRSFYKSSGDHQAVVLKSLSDGYPEWLRSYGTLGPDDGLDAVIKTYDNGFLSVGFTRSYGPGTQALLMYKLAADGTIAANTTVAIKEYAPPAGLSVFPNPATEDITFRADADFTLRVYDANGKPQMLGSLFLTNAYTVGVAGWPSGFYFGEMRFKDGSVHYEKVYILSK